MAEQVPLWASVLGSLFTLLVGGGGGVKAYVAWISYKTRGIELSSEKDTAAAKLEDSVYQRLEATLLRQIAEQAQAIAKHEERIEELERALRESHADKGKMSLKIAQMQDRVELALHQLQDLERALSEGDIPRAVLELEATKKLLLGVLGQTKEIGVMAEGSDPEEVEA